MLIAKGLKINKMKWSCLTIFTFCSMINLHANNIIKVPAHIIIVVNSYEFLIEKTSPIENWKS